MPERFTPYRPFPSRTCQNPLMPKRSAPFPPIPLLEAVRHTPHVCMAEAARAANRTLARHYGAYLDGTGIAPGQSSLLMQLYYVDAIAVTALAARMGTERTTMVRNIAALERTGQVETFTPDGSRVRKVRLTADGRDLLSGLVAHWDAAQQALKDRLGDDAWDTIMTALRTLADMEVDTDTSRNTPLRGTAG